MADIAQRGLAGFHLLSVQRRADRVDQAVFGKPHDVGGQVLEAHAERVLRQQLRSGASSE